MPERTLFDPPPIAPSEPTLEGEIELDGRTYRWALHMERVAADWTEQLSPHRREYEPPGFAFGLRAPNHAGDWRPVHLAGRVWTAWNKHVRKDPRVREVLGDRLRPGGGT